jgi:AcrR family transcriptional regulator
VGDLRAVRPPPEPVEGIEPARGRKRRAERRAQIVAAAAQIFARDGYRNVGMREIADAVGIRGAGLYHHFSAREEILFAIFLTVTCSTG